ncbi:RagB/SusD family nutrient uptake outer membrane protein [Prevotella sp. 10(H)]|uniref:RagB/SusD family nutrient uptake outer membrane protein n=1 Tax=Prevotella sp. 10(H) TaxID=1158294 RepID=UPI0004A737B1|nr:RagB/SusD family nutrient uptake outer membrane protein [Prevotella sp. 10(H)]
MKKIIYIIGLITIMLMPSCSDVLDLTPTDRYAESLVWQDENLLKMYVNEQYTGICNNSNYYQIMYFSDDNFAKYNGGSVNIIRENILTSDNVNSLSNILRTWDDSYRYIQNINAFFKNIDSSPVDAEVKKTLTAEIKFVRAYIYAKLIWAYGGVPIIEEVYDISSDWSQVKRKSWEECVAYIIKDLDDVITALPDRPAVRNRASGNAARALKARVLLYHASKLNNPNNDMQRWQDAADAAEDLFDKGYTLATDYRTMFIDVNCSEFILCKEFNETSSTNFTFIMGVAGDNGRAWVTPSLNLVDAYETTDGEIPVIDSELGTVNPKSMYDPANPFANRDPRFYASVYYNGAQFRDRKIEIYKDVSTDPPTYSKDLNSQDASMTGYYLRKFIEEDLGIAETRHYTGPFPLFRLSEMYLNYAEAQYHLGNEDLAREYINKIRGRESVKMPAITDTGEKLLERIYHERFIELAFEGHRYFDVRRWKIADKTETTHIMGHEITKEKDGKFTYKRYKLTQDSRKDEWKDAFYRLPIHYSEIQKSKNSLEQNPGYDLK